MLSKYNKITITEYLFCILDYMKSAESGKARGLAGLLTWFSHLSVRMFSGSLKATDECMVYSSELIAL